MTRIRLFNPQTLVLALSPLLLLACESSEQPPSSTVRGVVHDDYTASQTARWSNTGDGHMMVQAKSIENDGSFTLLGEAEVDGDGHYEMELPSEQDRVVLHVIDVSGVLVSGAILTTTGEPGGIVLAPPCNAEGLLEVLVFEEMVGQVGDVGAIDTTDLRMRIDHVMAGALSGTSLTNLQVIIGELAKAINLSQLLETSTWGHNGLPWTQGELFESCIPLVLAYDELLNEAGMDTDAIDDAHAWMLHELTLLEVSLGIGYEVQSDSESSSSAAYRISLDLGLVDLDIALGDFLDAAMLCAGEREAVILTLGIEELLRMGDADETTLIAAILAGELLLGGIDGAESPGEMTFAFEAYVAALLGQSSVDGSLIGNYLGLDLASILALDLLVFEVEDLGDVYVIDLNDILISGLDLGILPIDMAEDMSDLRAIYIEQVIEVVYGATLLLEPGQLGLVSILLGKLGGCYVAPVPTH